MTLLIIIFRKILKNKLLYFSLLLGLIISVALISSIPMYTEGILNRMLIKELENIQTSKQKYPGYYSIFFSAEEDGIGEEKKIINEKKADFFKNEKIMDYYRQRIEIFRDIDSFIKEKAINNIRLPIMSSTVTYSTDIRKIQKTSSNYVMNSKKNYAYLQSSSNIEKHIELIDGKIPSASADSGIYEVMITQSVLNAYDLLLGQEYSLIDERQGGFEEIRIKPVGIFMVSDPSDPYWIEFDPDNYFSESFIINEDLMIKDFISKSPTALKSAQWNYVLDYHSISIGKLPDIQRGFAENSNSLGKIYSKLSFRNPSINVVQAYYDKQDQLKIMLWALNVPVIIMLFMYIFMLCKLIVDKERNEIALLNSRGASRTRIVVNYLMQGTIIGAVAFIVGPFIGYFLTKLLGASSGFIEFVHRKSIVTHLGRDAYMYSFYVVITFLLIMLIPVFSASKVSIIDHKKGVSRKNKRPIWSKFFLDILLLIVAFYGYYSFEQRQKIIRLTGISAIDLTVEPLLFFVPALFILGVFLLFLRIYPYIIKMIYFIGRKKWSPSMYTTLIQVGRSASSYHFLMVFLSMTLSVGIFSATAARTINRNSEEKILYGNGGDIILTTKWESDSSMTSNTGTLQLQIDSNANTNILTPIRIQYSEPPFTKFTSLKGVEYAARVYRNNAAYVTNTNNETIENVGVMGIDSYDFGSVTWFRGGLLPYHINEYLNSLSSDPTGCIISESLSKKNNIKVGDNIQMCWNGAPNTGFTVLAVVDYWPSFNPSKVQEPNNNSGEPMLMVTNLSYIQDHMALEPYEVWIKLKEDVATNEVYKSISDNNLPVLSIKNTIKEITDIKTSPLQMAINGGLTLGFLICQLICFLGFLLYWILEMNSRTLQYGIFRAMGLKIRKLILMIIWEQLLTSGVAVASGIIIGFKASKLFVPFFQLSLDAASQVPPFRVISYKSDLLKIDFLIGITMIVVIGLLGYFIKNIKIYQAIKPGEE